MIGDDDPLRTIVRRFTRIRRIYLECHKAAEPRHNDTDLSAFLRQQGYRVEIGRSIDWRISRLYCERA